MYALPEKSWKSVLDDLDVTPKKEYKHLFLVLRTCYVWYRLMQQDCDVQPRSQGPLSTSRKYPGCGWSRVYVYKSNPHRGWIIDLILSTLSMEVKVALLLYLES